MNAETVRQVRALTGLSLKETYDWIEDKVRRHLDPIAEAQKIADSRNNNGLGVTGNPPPLTVKEVRILMGCSLREAFDFTKERLAQRQDPVLCAQMKVHAGFERDQQVHKILLAGGDAKSMIDRITVLYS